MGPTSQLPDDSAGNQSRTYPSAVFLTPSHERTKWITPWRICEGTTPRSGSEAAGTAVADELSNESIALGSSPALDASGSIANAWRPPRRAAHLRSVRFDISPITLEIFRARNLPADRVRPANH